MIENIKLTTRTDSGSLIRVAAKIERRDGRVWFVESPYSLKDEIKAMRGSRWHGYDDENPQKMWSVEDCQAHTIRAISTTNTMPLSQAPMKSACSTSGSRGWRLSSTRRIA